MKTVRSFANEEEEAEVYSRKLQQVYKLNRKEAAAYMYYVWGSGVRAPDPGQDPPRGAGRGWDTQVGVPHSRTLAGALHVGVRLVALDLAMSQLCACAQRSVPGKNAGSW